MSALAKKPHSILDYFSSEQIELIKSQICKDATDDELMYFLAVCQKMELDPISKQIYSIKRGNQRTIQVSIDGYRVIAERSGKYAGQTPPEWCGEDGKWKQVWTSKNYPVASRCGVYRIGFVEPIYAVAYWESYCQKYNGKISDMWAKFSCLMLHKCAETMALRKAFPNEMSGTYGNEEMEQATIINTKAIGDDYYSMVEQEKEDKKKKLKELGERSKDTIQMCKQLGIDYPVEQARKFYKEGNAIELENLLDEYDDWIQKEIDKENDIERDFLERCAEMKYECEKWGITWTQENFDNLFSRKDYKGIDDLFYSIQQVINIKSAKPQPITVETNPILTNEVK